MSRRAITALCFGMHYAVHSVHWAQLLPIVSTTFSCCPYRVTVAAAVTLLVCMRNHGIPLLSKLGVDITNHTVECEKNTILKL